MVSKVRERAICNKRIKISTETVKYILVFVLLCVFGIKGYSQNESKYVGIYSQTYDDRTAELFVFPNHQFMMVSSMLNRGTWSECDGNLILHPTKKEKEKSICLYGRYDDRFPTDSIYINFKELEDKPVLYSFNNESNKPAMHSVYNLFPNCFNISGSFAEYMSKRALKKGDLNTIQLMFVPNIYGNVEFNDSENEKFKGSILGRQQNFALPPQYNDYQVIINGFDDERLNLPIMATLYKNGLYFDAHLFGEKESLQKYDKAYLDSLMLLDDNAALTSKHFSEYRYDRGYEEWVNYEYELIPDISPNLNKEVSFDLQYLITENCNGKQDDDESYNGKYTSVTIDENTRKSMSYWKTFTTRLVDKNIDELVTMIDFPLLRTTDEDSIGTSMSKEDFLADFDNLFSPYVVEIFKTYTINNFLKDRRYHPESMDDDGRIYSLEYDEEKGSVSIYVREKDQMIDTELILKEKDGRLKLKEISTQVY